jgi:isopentenyldiphosphate isomerase/intracellular septation protein A
MEKISPTGLNMKIKKNIVLTLLSGFLPLIVFIVVDEFVEDVRISIGCALGFSLIEFLFTYVKNKKIDFFIFFDAAVIGIMGGISLASENEVFIKLKPAIMEFIMVLILAVSAFTPANLMLKMSSRYMKGVEFNDEAVAKMRRMSGALAVVFFLHTVLIVVAAFAMSQDAWSFISVGLFFVIAGVFFGGVLLFQVLKRKKYMSEEQLPIVDENGVLKGSAPRSLCHRDKSLLHPVVHLHVFNSRGELYLQKRPENKLIQPGKWDTAVGGHVSAGDSISTALSREAFEEIGIQGFEAQPLTRYLWESEVERELVYMFFTVYDGDITPDSEELDGGKFWSLTDLEQSLTKEIFTPNFEQEFKILREVFPKLTKK